MASSNTHRPALRHLASLRVAREGDERGVEGNARLTASIAAVLLVLLAAEGATILRIGPLLSAHVFIGMVLIPPIVLKMASTGYRFVRYYAGSPAYREKGPPPVVLRLIGPFIVVLTTVMFASGVALVFTGTGLRQDLLKIHQVSFVLWFGVMAIHVLGHLLDTVRLAGRDFSRRQRRQVQRAGVRQWVIAVSLVVGVVLAALTIGRASHYFVSLSTASRHYLNGTVTGPGTRR